MNVDSTVIVGLLYLFQPSSAEIPAQHCQRTAMQNCITISAPKVSSDVEAKEFCTNQHDDNKSQVQCLAFFGVK